MDHQVDEILYVCKAVLSGEADKESVRRVARRLVNQLEEDGASVTQRMVDLYRESPEKLKTALEGWLSGERPKKQ